MSNKPSSIPDAALQDLQSGFLGEILTADAPDYDQARKVWNDCIDRYPSLVLRPKSKDDVVSAVRFARAQKLPLAVRGGGHSVPGYSTVDDGIVLDLRGLADIEANPDKGTILVGGGALLGDVDVAAQAHGMAVPVGVVGHTGVGGLTLGGGFGRLHRKYGLTIDNLISVELVTAEGKIVRASETENPELFWGIRGAGANFGVVTTFEFRMHPIGTMMDAAMQIYTLDNAAEAIVAFAEWMADAPDNVTGAAMLTRIPPGGPFPPDLVGTPVLMAPGMHLGDPSEAQAALAPMAELGTPMFAGQMQIPYLALQTMTDDFYGWGKRYYIKGRYMQTPNARFAEVVVNAFKAAPSAHCEFNMLPMGGALARVPEDATAFTGRSAPFFIGIEATFEDPTQDEAHQAWVRKTMSELEPFFVAGNYVNAAAETDSVRAVYGDAKYDRLVALKREWDPENVFRLNGNIKP